jgi:acyl-CoA thioester hydrolase
MMGGLTHRVRYHECDQQGYLFNGRYLEIADVGMTEFFRDLGWSYDDLNMLGADPSVVHLEAEFFVPARFDDELVVQVSCTHVGTSSFKLLTHITRGGTDIAQIKITYVNVDTDSDRSVPLPEVVTAALRSPDLQTSAFT